MTLNRWLAILLGAFLLSGCAGMDPEDRDFYNRNIIHPGMDADEREFWYSRWFHSDRF
jgi:PBP1b-binding outer membrane lipoprotein LpoB